MEKAFCITEKDISQKIGKTIPLPVRIANLASLGLNTQLFLDFFSDVFEELPWDFYDVKRMQVNFLQIAFPKDRMKIQKLLKPYFQGKISLDAFSEWTNQFSYNHQKAFDKIKPWQRHSVCQFILRDNGNGIKYEQIPREQTQEIEDDSRVFQEIPEEYLENEMFISWLKANYDLAEMFQPNKSDEMNITVHFMRIHATKLRPNEEKEKTNQFSSTLFLNRQNIQGGESQIIENKKYNTQEIIFSHTLQRGEFVFNKNSGNGQVHHVISPISIGQSRLGKAWLDLIRLDI